MIKYWCELCPVCQEGYLFIYRRKDTGHLYLHCDECESAFAQVRDIEKEDGGFIGDEIDSIAATWEDIRGTQWEDLVKGQVECDS